jgi:hypothetical protein
MDCLYLWILPNVCLPAQAPSGWYLHRVEPHLSLRLACDLQSKPGAPYCAPGMDQRAKGWD